MVMSPTRPGERVGQDAYVLETNEVGDDLCRIDVHTGVRISFTLRLKRLRAYAVDPP